MPADDTKIRLRNLIISLLTFAALVLYASTYSEPVLRVSVLPDESPMVVRRKLKPLTDYLEKKVGLKIEFRPMLDGETLVEALIGNKLDMVWLDGANFIQAKARSNDGVIPLVQRAEDVSAMPGYNDYSWTVRADMDANLRIKLSDAFLALDPHNGLDKEILDLQRATKFVPARIGSHAIGEAAARRPGAGP